VNQRETYPIEIAGISRELPLFEIKPGLRIAVLNILGDTELVQASAILSGYFPSCQGNQSVEYVSGQSKMPVISDFWRDFHLAPCLGQ